jgi:hypothetical protein
VRYEVAAVVIDFAAGQGIESDSVTVDTAEVRSNLLNLTDPEDATNHGPHLGQRRPA